ncbi:type I polyketide synthase [Gluconobacter frateurii]|uniref:type I polyketide synthase n=1 Tax=Gluconobacter frateurii TaxID=38308 RepID=UPI001F05F6E8|nr:type I polyketide synthase [Gluconobacter frateurii]UMM08096.1 type I polyketide synthase [Gluconobacter frateurii]
MVDYGNEVAVVGIGCRLPGGIETTDALWRFLCDKGDASSDVPADRWGIKRFYDPEYETPNKTYMRRGSFITQKIDEMDPLFFGISPREAAIMDPQQRLLLEVVWEAMEDAGILPASLTGTRTGVFIGTFSLDWLVACGSPLNRPLITDHFAATAASATMLAARISHNLGLQGPCMSIDTACSSSLVAVHQACTSLLTAESDVVVAGGVNIMVAPPASITMSKGHFLATDGRCKSFSADADGYGRGEGCGIVLLKRLADAERDGDFIHGVITGTGVNQDGRTLSLTMPSEDAQRDLLLDVARRAEIDPADIGYVEAHGTGTPVGDPIEARALGTSIGQKRPADKPLVIGSVKANLGHLEAAAGVTGLIKALLCLKNGAVPPQPNLEVLNPSIPFGDLGLNVPNSGEVHLKAPVEGKRVYAGVNSFGYGGTNAVAFLRAYNETPQCLQKDRTKHLRPSGQLLLPVNAVADASLRALARSYAELLEAEDGPSIEDVCFSAASYRSRLPLQAVICGESKDALVRGLMAVSEGKTSASVVTGRRRNGEMQQPVFVFSGMGSQWKGMGHHILRYAPQSVLETVRYIDTFFTGLSGWSILEEILRPEEQSRIDETIIAQPAIFIIQVALAGLFRLHGVMPVAIVGHSVGEVAASYVAGALTLEDAVTVIFHRSQQQARLAGRGTMLAVGLSGAEAEEKLIGDHKELVSVAALNSARSCTLAGDEDALKAIARHCDQDGIFNRLLKVEIPYHSIMMEEIREELLAPLETLSPTVPETVLYSTVTGARWGENERHDAAYWYANARQPVLFHDAIQELLKDGHRVFLEIGAHPVLSGLIRESAQFVDGDVVVVPSLSRKDSENTAMARSMARLYMAGVPLDWSLLTGGQRTTLPHYAWARSRFWSETEISRRDRLDGTVHPVLGMPINASRPEWRADINRNYMPWLPDHQVDGLCLFPAAGYIEGALAVHGQIENSDAAILEDLEIGQALLLDSLTPPVVDWAFDAETRVLTVSSVHGNSGEEEWIQHAKLRVLASAPWTVETVVPNSLLEGLTHEISPDIFYARLADHGFSYGPSFQVIKELKVGRGAAYARLEFAEAQQIGEYFLHPALLDGAFQALIGAGYDPAEERVFIPVGVRQIIYRGGRHNQILARAILTKQSEKGIEGNILLVTEEGESVAEILGFKAKAIQKLKGNSDTASIGRRLYRPTWIKTDQLPLFAAPLTVTAFGRESSDLAMLQQVFGEQGLMVDIWPIHELDDRELEHALSSTADSILYLCDTNLGDTGEDGIEDILRLARGIKASEEGDTVPRFVVATRAAVSADEEFTEQLSTGQAAVRGFSRGVSSERPDLALRIVDIGRQAIEPLILRQLCAEVMQQDAEDDIILRPEIRAVCRLTPSENRPDPVSTSYHSGETVDGKIVGVRLVSGSTGSLDKLHHERFVCEPPQAGQVVFRTLAASLNFKDILKATGLIPQSVVEDTFHGESLGMEASVEVVSVGSCVEGFSPGERYLVSWPGCFASHFTADAKDIFALPLHGLGSPLEAATLPVAFVTAYYGLCRLAQLAAGETVLIHAGTGGVGLAAIQLAQKIGARVFATAGSPEKRQYLKNLGCEEVWDSRSLEFVEGVEAVTHGRGVDVVLNSLPGEGQTHSLSLVAPYGRFVEIGKKDIIEKRGLPLAPFNENLSFFSLDLDRMMHERPSLMRSLLSDVAGLLTTGSVKPLPYSNFPAEKASDAFRLLASAKHIGKVVIDYSHPGDLKAYPLARVQPHVCSEGTYLITGGLGGFGWATAEWLIGQGAQHLLLLSRRALEETEISQKISKHLAAGIKITTLQADVSDSRKMAGILEGLTQSGEHPPLKGVFHCAGILDDGLIYNLDSQRISRVLRSKAESAIILDNLTRAVKLDYFVMFSSVTTLLGNIGQSAYIAANSVLAAIATNRWQAGHTALAVDWGAISDVGMLSRNENAARALEAAGLKGMTAQDALGELPRMLTLDIPEVACVDIDWKKWAQIFPGADQSARFSLVRLADSNSEGVSARLAALSVLPEDERLPYVVEQVKVLIAHTLHLEPTAIDDRARLSELGIDSLAGVELQTALRVEFGVEVSILVLARDESIQKMSQFLLNRIKIGQTTNLP